MTEEEMQSRIYGLESRLSRLENALRAYGIDPFSFSGKRLACEQDLQYLSQSMKNIMQVMYVSKKDAEEQYLTKSDAEKTYRKVTSLSKIFDTRN